MAYTELEQSIVREIKDNDSEEITGNLLQSILLQMVRVLGEGYQFIGIATPETTPYEGDAKVFYLCGKGDYSNFGDEFEVSDDSLGILLLSDEWTLQTISISRSAISANDIENGAITEDKIGSGAVSTNKIADDSVSENKLKSDSVTENKIKNGAVTENKIASDAVTENKIKNGAVTENKISSDAITENKIANNAVTENKIANKAVSRSKLSQELVDELNRLANEGYRFDGVAQIGETPSSPNVSMFKIANTVGLYTQYGLQVFQDDGVCAFTYNKSEQNPVWRKMVLGIAFPPETELTVETFNTTALSAQLNKYYIASSAVENLTITLPAISNLTKTRSIMFNLTTGSNPNIQFVSADSKAIGFYEGLIMTPSTEYEFNALFNGVKWIITHGVIA